MNRPHFRPLLPQLRMESVKLDAHHRFFIAILVAAATFLLVRHGHLATRVVVTWIAYSVTVLLLTWYMMVTSVPQEVARTASLQDSSRTFIFIFVVVAAIASVFAVAVELGSAKGLDREHLTGHVAFSILTVLASWTLVHTVFTLRYAHIFYGSPEGDEARGGLNFPEEEHPDYLDFAYFAFTIGMCAQVSDVTVGARRLRRLVLMHSVISFGFNAAILGLSINMVSGLFS